jgi:hypothetical protein
MRNLVLSFVVVGLLANVLTAAEPSKAAVPSPAAMMKAIADAGRPGPEHQKLQPLIGSWTFTLTMWTDPSQPPATATGTVERKWVMGDRFVQESLRGQCGGEEFDGLGLWGYDAQQKKFSIVRACGFCGKSTQELATCDASGKKFTYSTEECCPLTGETVKGRDEIVFETPDRIVVNVYKTLGEQEAKVQEVKVMEIVSVRKK